MKKLIAVMCIFSFIVITANYTDALCVKVPKSNLRTGPGTDYDIAWEVYKYMPFQKVGESLSKNWYAVKDVDGDVNWLHKKLVTDEYQCAVVKKAKVNVRTGPGTKYSTSSISPATQYYSFRVLKKKGIWVRVKDEWDNIGWIHSDYLWIQ